MIRVMAWTTEGFIHIGNCRRPEPDDMRTGYWTVKPQELPPSVALPAELRQAANPALVFCLGAMMKPRNADERMTNVAGVALGDSVPVALRAAATMDVEVFAMIDAYSPHPSWLPEWREVKRESGN